MHNPVPQAETTAAIDERAVLGGRVRLLQPVRGYRAGLDAALLASAVGGSPGERVLEAGCGAGGALLQMAARAPDASFTGLEREVDALTLARRNIALNGLEARAVALAGDVAEPFSKLALDPFDAVAANPPFFDDPAALRTPAPERRAAWMAEDGLQAWTGFLLKAARQGGLIVVIHRTDRLADLLTLLGAGAGSFAIRPVQPFMDAAAKRVILRAIKSGRAPLRLLPSLVLHDREGGAKHTAQADAILRGEASLSWD